MPLTPEQIVEETRDWPLESLAELVDRLTIALHGSAALENDAEWRREARRRLSEIESGTARAIPGEEVSAKVQGIVAE